MIPPLQCFESEGGEEMKSARATSTEQPLVYAPKEGDCEEFTQSRPLFPVGRSMKHGV